MTAQVREEFGGLARVLEEQRRERFWPTSITDDGLTVVCRGAQDFMLSVAAMPPRAVGSVLWQDESGEVLANYTRRGEHVSVAAGSASTSAELAVWFILALLGLVSGFVSGASVVGGRLVSPVFAVQISLMAVGLTCTAFLWSINNRAQMRESNFGTRSRVWALRAAEVERLRASA